MKKPLLTLITALTLVSCNFNTDTIKEGSLYQYSWYFDKSDHEFDLDTVVVLNIEHNYTKSNYVKYYSKRWEIDFTIREISFRQYTKTINTTKQATMCVTGELLYPYDLDSTSVKKQKAIPTVTVKGQMRTGGTTAPTLAVTGPMSVSISYHEVKIDTVKGLLYREEKGCNNTEIGYYIEISARKGNIGGQPYFGMKATPPLWIPGKHIRYIYHVDEKGDVNKNGEWIWHYVGGIFTDGKFHKVETESVYGLLVLPSMNDYEIKY